MNATVVGLHLHTRHGEHPRAVDEVVGRIGGGIEGDSHVDRPKRAVVIADRSAHEALGLQPGDLREQITVEGVPGVSLLPPDSEIAGAGDVEAFQASLQGRRGAVCTVVAVTGPARIGDAVVVLPARVGV
jgi:hypothetical protein